MVEVVNLAFELFDGVGREPEFLCRQIPMYRNRPGGTAGIFQAPVFAQGGDLVRTFLADQKMHYRPFAFEQFLDKAFSYESGRSGNEVLHAGSSNGCEILTQNDFPGPQH